MKSQRKGADGERELADLLRVKGFQITRGGSLSFGERPDLSGLPGVHIECKRVERLNITEAMAQAIRDAERFQDGAPCVFHRRNRQPWLVTMRLEDWLEFYRKGVNHENQDFVYRGRARADHKGGSAGKEPVPGSPDTSSEAGE